MVGQYDKTFVTSHVQGGDLLEMDIPIVEVSVYTCRSVALCVSHYCSWSSPERAHFVLEICG